MGWSKSSSKREIYGNTIPPEETRNISNKQLTLHLKQLEKEEHKNPKGSRRKEIIKIRSEINEKETKETIAKINKTKSWFFEKINKIDKPLARLIKEKGEKTQFNRIKNKKGEVTSDIAEIQRSMRDYDKQLYGNKMETWKKWKILRKAQPSETEPGRNRKYKQTNHKHWNWDCD